MFGKRLEKYVIVGCGRFGARLAGLLSERGFDVIAVDRDSESFRRLPTQFSGFQMEADGTDPDTLLSARIQPLDTLVAATESDNVNCMISQMACTMFHLSQVYARLTDIAKERLLEGFTVKAIYPTQLSLREFQKMSNLDLQEGDKS